MFEKRVFAYKSLKVKLNKIEYQLSSINSLKHIPTQKTSEEIRNNKYDMLYTLSYPIYIKQ